METNIKPSLIASLLKLFKKGTALFKRSCSSSARGQANQSTNDRTKVIQTRDDGLLMDVINDNCFSERIQYKIRSGSTNMDAVAEGIRKELEIYFSQVDEIHVKSDVGQKSFQVIFSAIGDNCVKDPKEWPRSMRIGKSLHLQRANK